MDCVGSEVGVEGGDLSGDSDGGVVAGQWELVVVLELGFLPRPRRDAFAPDDPLDRGEDFCTYVVTNCSLRLPVAPGS